jgi:hypothetical protein
MGRLHAHPAMTEKPYGTDTLRHNPGYPAQSHRSLVKTFIFLLMYGYTHLPIYLQSYVIAHASMFFLLLLSI